MITVFHVATTGFDIADGSEGRPFRTINRAARVAQAGDTIVVHEGEYREWVSGDDWCVGMAPFSISSPTDN